eukprot:9291031-Lingulodinium_polyedra.AAC.1
MRGVAGVVGAIYAMPAGASTRKGPPLSAETSRTTCGAWSWAPLRTPSTSYALLANAGPAAG